MPLTLRDLLAFGCGGDHVAVTAERLSDRPIATAAAVAGIEEIGEVGPGTLVCSDDPSLAADEPGFVTALRLAAERRAAGLLVPGRPESVPPAVLALANHLDVAVVLTDAGDSPERIVAIMNLLLPATTSADAAVIGMVTRRLHQNLTDAEGMIRVLTTVLRLPVGVVDTQLRVVAGNLPAQALRDLPRGLRGRSARQQVHAVDEDSLLVVQPIRLAPASPVNLRIAAVVPAVPALARTVSQALVVAAWAFVAYLATVSLTLEREGGKRAALLTRLLDEAEAPAAYVLERATAAGWRLDGVHTGVHVRADGGDVTPSFLSYRLGEALVSIDRTSTPLPDGDGWSFWLTDLDDEQEARTLTALRTALLEVERSCEGVRMRAGIGAPGEGTAGIRDSLVDARLACAVARTREEPGAVERVGSSSATRLLIHHYVTDAQLGFARQLLGPLLTADPSGQLLRTLASYLDRQSSATGTAVDLGIHRNTVLQRLDRIRSLVPVDLTDPDERLGLHLAVRLLLRQSHPAPAALPGTGRPSAGRQALLAVGRTGGEQRKSQQPAQKPGRLLGHVHDHPVDHAHRRAQSALDQLRKRSVG
ncbi:PucR C-terminal helix-turn-helix domain-containing protein [Lentzea fradiae]|uniref:PucR C-terminal helix-turn-helix domain-containing protein n=1 Tax=Lentzea fradiae TaxID=200378 RepID=A0A1G7L7R0_9PSEU|nr:PucR C-terminal helix-turn-helix domain-containing protein [Lentzea fradiae]